MVSAGDFGYIPSVVFVSYFGSKVKTTKIVAQSIATKQNSRGIVRGGLEADAF